MRLYRVVADDNEQLIEEALLHTYEVHPEMDLTEEQARQMVENLKAPVLSPEPFFCNRTATGL
jgi:hypothetical protein